MEQANITDIKRIKTYRVSHKLKKTTEEEGFFYTFIIIIFRQYVRERRQ